MSDVKNENIEVAHPVEVNIENIEIAFPPEVQGNDAGGVEVDLPSSLSNKAFAFFLSLIRKEDGGVIEFDKPKQMVPSLERAKADSVLILQHSDAAEGVPATISIKLEVDLSLSKIKLFGYGFSGLVLSIETVDVEGIKAPEEEEGK